MMLFNLYRQLARAPSFLRHLIINSFFLWNDIFRRRVLLRYYARNEENENVGIFTRWRLALSLCLSFFF